MSLYERLSEVQVFLHVQKNQFYVYPFNYCTELWRPGRARPPSPDNVPPLPPPLPWFSYLYQHWQPIYQTKWHNSIVQIVQLLTLYCCETKPSQLSPSYLGYDIIIIFIIYCLSDNYEILLKDPPCLAVFISQVIYLVITSPLYLTTYLFSLLAIINLISLRCVYFKTNQ